MMKSVVFILLLGLISIGCSGTDTQTTDSGIDADGHTNDDLDINDGSDTDIPTEETDGSLETEDNTETEYQHIPYCQVACQTVADCDLSIPYLDLDNYTCNDGYCQYLGCNSDQECQYAGDYVCRDQGYGTSFCLPACQTVADCDFGTANMDSDNYSCEDGICVYQGCNSDAECQALGDYLCRSLDGGMPACYQACSTPDDCDSGVAYMDADNYVCPDDFCIYLGCNSDEECATVGDYICR
jgi:hypothetical protein